MIPVLQELQAKSASQEEETRKLQLDLADEKVSCPAVFQIHDILVWIRIRGSMPLNNGSGSGSFYFHH
jgi:hypothetical protein